MEETQRRLNYSTLRVAATVPSPALSKTWTGSDRITQPALVFFAVEGCCNQHLRRVRRSMELTWNLPGEDRILLLGGNVKTTEIVSGSGSSVSYSFDLPYFTQ